MQPSNNRKYTVNETYFDTINTPEKAYWLGFLWADGNISKTTDRSSGPNRLRIAQKKDEEKHLIRFQKEIESNHPLKYVMHKDNHIVAQIDINSRKLCMALQSIGFDNKDKRTQIPKIPNELISHFIRGYFDGDGCLSLYTQQIKKWSVNKQEWSITGNITFISNLQKIITIQAGVTPTVKLKQYKKSPTTASLRYGKIGDIIKLQQYLYRDATVYLPSKHKKFVEFLSRYASSRIAVRRSTNSVHPTPEH